MKLSDIMGHSGLSTYAEIAMILFMVAFLAIVLRIFWPSRRAELEQHRHMPLEDDRPMEPREGATR